MSKRQLVTDCPSPNIVIIPTDTFSGNDDPSLPRKKPKPAEISTPAMPKQVKMESDTIQVPPPPKLISEIIVIESDSPIKKEVHSVISVTDTAISKCDPNVTKKSPETQVELKTSTKQPSWASNYLKDIGLDYKKPIKINISSIKKKLNEEFEELNKSKSTDDEDTKEIKDENQNKIPLQSPIEMGILMNKSTDEDTSKEIKDENLNKFPLQSPNEMGILMNKSTDNDTCKEIKDVNLNKFPLQSPIEMGILMNKSTDEDTSKEIKDENLNKFPLQSPNEMGILMNKSTDNDTCKEIKDVNLNKFPLQSPNETGILMNNPSNNEVIGHHLNINPQPYFQLNQPQMLQINQNPHFELNHPTMLQINENPHFELNDQTMLQINENPHFELNHPAMLQINENPHFELNQPAMLQINEIPRFELNHPEMLQINGIPPTFRANFHNHESLYTHPATFTEYDSWSRKSIEDKSYLDKVDQFLRENSTKISQDRSRSQGYRTRLETKTRTRSLSLKNRDVAYSEKPQKINTSTKIDDKSRDGTKQSKEGIKKSYYPERVASMHPNRSKSTEKHSNVPSTSKQISYDEEKQKQTENSRRLEFITKYKKIVEEFTRRENEENCNIRSRLEYHRAEATDFFPKSTNKKYYKKRESSDSSSSEFVINKSYQDIKTQSNKKQIKRKRSSRSSSSENGCGGVKYKIIKQEKNYNRDSSSDSSSGSCSMPCCTRKIKASEKPHSSGRCKSSNSENHRLRSPEQAQKSQLLEESCRSGSLALLKSHKSRRDILSNSHSSEMIEARVLSHNSEIRKRRSPTRAQRSKLPQECCRGGSTPSKKHKSRRDRSNSHRSEKCEAELLCQTQKTKDKRKEKSRRETSNSSSNSETCVHKLPCTQRIREKKKRKRSNSRSNSEKSKSPNAHKYKEKSEKRKKSKTSKSSDRKKTRKDVTTKDKTKTIVIKPSSTGKDKESKETCKKEKELKSVTDVRKTESDCATIFSCKENSSIPDHKPKEPASVKSVVRIKGRRKSHHNTHETENFDLRSKLSRKGLSQCFSKIRNKNNETESKTSTRENLVITVTNQDEDTDQLTVANEDETKQKILKTATDKLIEITRKHQDNSKIKKHKKLKLVINVVCESSQSSDSDDVGDTTCKNPDKERERKDESTIMKKVVTESNLSNELSFLDDFNIDEIVDSLTRNKNESCPLKDTTDTAITVESSSSPEIVFDTYDLISDSENSVSDASTVHLEELRETHDNSNTSENNNKNPQSERIVNVVNKLDTEDANINTSIKLEKSGCGQIAMMCEKDVKQEIIFEENKDLTSLSTDERMKVKNDESVTNEVAANQAKCSQEVVVKKEPVHNALDECLKILGIKSKELEPLLESKTKIVKVDVNNSNNNVMPVDKIKKELVGKDNEEAKITEHIETDSNLVSINAIMENSGEVQDDKVKSSENKETERNIQDVNETQGSQVTAVLINKIKEETTVAGCTLYLNSPELDLPLISPNDIKEEKINDVPNESSIKNKLENVEKNITKENTSHIGEDRKEEPEKAKHNHFNNLLSDVCVSGSVTNISTQSKICSCGKNVSMNKVNVPNSINISDSIDLTLELNDVKEEPNSDTENADEFTIAVISTSDAPVHTVSEKAIYEGTEKEVKHDGHIQSNITEVKSNKEVCLNEDKKEPNFDTETADTVTVLKTTDTPVSTVENKEIKHDEHIQLNVTQVESKKEVAYNTILDSEHKLNKNTEPTEAKNKMPEIIDSNNTPQKVNIDSASESLKLKIESEEEVKNNEVFDKPNGDSSQNTNILSNSDKKISKDQEQPKPTPNVVKNDNLQEKDTASERHKLQIESVNKEVSDKPNKDSSQNNNIVSNSDKKVSKREEQPKPTPNVIKKNNLQEKDTAAKSRSHSPIRVKYRQTKRSQNGPRMMIEKLEERLVSYLHEPYTVDSFLHKGKFSKIYKCSDSKGQNYVVKIVRNTINRHIRGGLSKEKMMQSLQKDIPEENLNFVRFFNGLEASGNWCFLMEYCPKNLCEVLQENKKSLHINTVQHLSRQLVTALRVLRHHNVVHADINPKHILLNSEVNRLKLGGFDCAFYYDDKPQLLPSVGTVNYRAPETILGYSTDYKIDVWAAALVMYEMATRRQLFPGLYNNDILFKQMCTRGFIPSDMINQSQFAYQHFNRTLFMRRVGPLGQNKILCREDQLYRNNLLEATIKSAYYKEWYYMNIHKHQRRAETGMMYSFIQLLEKMLIVHPQYRLTIKDVYTHPFLFDNNKKQPEGN